nr:hypothetical protein [Burkholderia gladioli]
MGVDRAGRCGDVGAQRALVLGELARVDAGAGQPRAQLVDAGGLLLERDAELRRGLPRLRQLGNHLLRRRPVRSQRGREFLDLLLCVGELRRGVGEPCAHLAELADAPLRIVEFLEPRAGVPQLLHERAVLGGDLADRPARLVERLEDDLEAQGTVTHSSPRS